jgi:D-3-phosphoglycerate dehydrogenase / 2-oxoglutarate reductase
MTTPVARPARESSVLQILPIQDPIGVEILSANCASVRCVDDGNTQDVMREIENVDAVIVRGPGRLTREMIGTAKALRIISVSGVGLDCVDIPAATERGLPVLFYPGFSALPVAEYSLAGLLICSRRLGTADAECRKADFDPRRRSTDLNGYLVAGSALGVVGLGRIGSQIARLAEAVGMKVTAYDPAIVTWPEGVERATDLDAMLGAVDYVALACPLTPETELLIDTDRIRAMKQGACLVNAARGELVDEQALADALSDGHLAYAVVDVVASEPDVWKSPLTGAPNCMVTPHIAGNTRTSTHATCRAIATTVIDALNGTFDPERVVNPEVLEGVAV